MPAKIPAVVFIGGGPRTAGVLERLAANRPDVFAGPLEIHVVEPHVPGSGRIWRYDQDPGLLLNSMAADITMFTDDSVACDGPAAAARGWWSGPPASWTASITDVPDFPQHLQDQLRTLTGTTFPTRQLQSQYLEWFFRRAARALDRSVTVHRSTAVGISPLATAAARRRAGQRPDAARRPPGDRAGPHRFAARRRVLRLRRTSPPGTAATTRHPATPPTSTTRPSPRARTSSSPAWAWPSWTCWSS